MSLWATAAVLLVACGNDGAGTQSSADTQAGAGASTAQTDAPTRDGLPPDPQQIDFQASDGQMLEGVYYPAATDPAPIAVLLHWGAGDLSDWWEVAPWLQNRGLANPFTNPDTRPWWDPSWFPEVPENMSVGVFIITFRGCTPFPAGCQTLDPEGWLLDAQAALTHAATLDGADPSRIAAIGSSIGADGAVDACFAVNEQTPGSCVGALSLSPGSFLDIPYVEAVENLGNNDPTVPAWCLASPDEIDFCTAAEGAGNSEFQTFEIIEGRHGNGLMVPEADPSTMQTMIEFLALVFAD
ncbi:MAG: hypothetical protein HY826_07260 [Actinobacteria bacterium]|nr:hypothetical protein [Actinomycetota bacterium]